MTYEIYRYIFIGGAILAGVMLVVSVLVFFLMNIPNVIGDLSGANARKAIESIRNQNEKSSENKYQGNFGKSSREQITDKISRTGRLVKARSNNLRSSFGERVNTQQLKGNCTNETTVLDSTASETTVLNPETTVLSPETTVLTQTSHVPQFDSECDANVAGPAETFASAFVIEYAITYIHTEEIIS